MSKTQTGTFSRRAMANDVSSSLWGKTDFLSDGTTVVTFMDIPRCCLG